MLNKFRQRQGSILIGLIKFVLFLYVIGYVIPVIIVAIKQFFQSVVFGNVKFGDYIRHILDFSMYTVNSFYEGLHGWLGDFLERAPWKKAILK